MAGTFEQSMDCATERFEKRLVPVLNELFKGTREFIQVENIDNIVCKELDINCGIDCLLKNTHDKTIKGVALRIQQDVDYRTFTVRNERDSGTLSEYEKRLRAIKNGSLRPSIAIQAYVKNGALVSLGIAQEKDIIEYIEKGFAELKHTGKQQIGQASFYAVDWEKFRNRYFLITAISENGRVKVLKTRPIQNESTAK